jgi:hypothetical protein
MIVRSKIDGTMSSSFGIGKQGPTIFQGSSNPNVSNQTAVNGDIYVRVGATPTMYQFRSNTWVDVTGEVFSRTAVTISSYGVLGTDFYLGVRVNGPVNLVLPQGTFGKKYIIKDEIGSASQTNTISIMAGSSDTIDGKSSFVINTARSAVTIVYGVEWHVI